MSGVPPVNPRSCPTNATVPVKIFQYDRDPTSADFRNFKIRDFWANQVDNTLWYCSYMDTFRSGHNEPRKDSW